MAKKGGSAGSKSGYLKKIISIDEKEERYRRCIKSIVFERKANISGGCLHLYSDSDEWEDQWDENWYFIDENIRSHAKIFSIRSGAKAKGKPTVHYDPVSRTAFVENNNYYGWLKSVALALMGDVFEDNHSIFSCHGALLSLNNAGIAIIGPSGTGKTTLSYGLLAQKNTAIMADDWFYFKFINGHVRGYRSEKNTYIRADLSESWPQYKNVMKYAKVDNRGRAIVSLSNIVGREKIGETANINKIILLRRERGKPVVERLKPERAIKYLEGNDYFNPHILHHSSWKKRVRSDAFLKLLKKCDIILLNTIESPQQSLARVMEFARE